MIRWAGLLLMVGVSACAAAPSAGAGGGEEERVSGADGKAEPPFSAAEIRAATAPGRTYHYRMGVGDEVHERLMVFVRVDDEGAEIEHRVLGPDGEVAETTPARRSTWQDLEGHATYPRAGTTVSEVEITVPAGTFAGWLYEVREQTDKGPQLTRAWFARELPGAPVKHQVEVGGQLVHQMVLLRHEAGAAEGAR